MLSLQEMSDRLEIQDLITRYAYAIDEQDWNALDRVFTPDAVIDYTELGGAKGSLSDTKAYLAQAMPTFPAFQHDGLELLFMLEGEVDYRHGDQIYALKPGDSLFFDADAPHGPEVLVRLPARYLSVIAYPQT